MQAVPDKTVPPPVPGKLESPYTAPTLKKGEKVADDNAAYPLATAANTGATVRAKSGTHVILPILLRLANTEPSHARIAVERHAGDRLEGWVLTCAAIADPHHRRGTRLSRRSRPPRTCVKVPSPQADIPCSASGC